MTDQQQPRPASLEHWAARKPDVVVAIEGDRALRWGELNVAANWFAEALADLGLCAGDIVAVRTQVRLEWLVVNAALAKLGCVLLGVNGRLTVGEIDFMLRNSGAAALVCDDADPAALAPLLDRVRFAVSLMPSPGFHSYADLVAGDAPPRYSTGETPLIIYTSGTTGQPKGVLLGRRHDDPPPSREAIEYAASVAAASPKGEDDIILVSMPLSHGSAPAQIRRLIQAGGRIVLTRRFMPEETLQMIAKHQVTAWVAVPTMLNRIAALPPATVAAYDLSSMRSIQVGAAPVAPTIKQWVAETFGDILHEGYGSTETGMVSNLTPDMYRQRPLSCGRPYSHVDISIRDAERAELAAGATGEIWVRTPVVLRHYFGGDPLGPDVLDADGFFRTGDVGYLDDEGYLFITGRMKDMIVSGGVNIYPAEIEAALHGHPAVQDVAVIGIPDSEFGEQVKAFIELKPGMQADPADVIAHGRATLASYKLPRSIDIVAELPRNVTGKVMKQDLRAAFWADKERSI